MVGDSSNRRTFLKAMGLTAASSLLPVGLGASVAGAASVPSGLGSLEAWLLDTGIASMEAGVYVAARQELGALLSARGEALPY
ncbi:hypothetical protein KRR26_14095 [Corallococcus sp. M34]|uniref:hypothetical protein n=1 Tax=Citreicoccus inhibens TaxID=2849499 RepID=UPI001315A1A3|nr:hypothetical protein [Citreicoccus inhibens]MBU8896745.1 hypothetical protein [Citreicoccus inhibens]